MANKDKEIWKQIPLPKGSTNKNYAVSNHGRLASFDKDISDVYVLKTHDHEGYSVCTIKVGEKSKALFPHQLIGLTFLKKSSPKQKFVIHLDYDKKNNHISNLKWATPKELSEHSKKSPHVLEAIKRRVYTGSHAKKLDEKKVTQLKKEIWNPKRKATMKQLAEKYGIAEMNLYRIKSGELWYHIHVDGEPVSENYKNHLKNLEYHKKQVAKTEVVNKKKEAEKKKKADFIKKQIKESKKKVAKKETKKTDKKSKKDKKHKKSKKK